MSQNEQGNREKAPRTILINPLFRQQIPQVLKSAASVSSRNPNKMIAKGAHINPLFLMSNRPRAIHMNPLFLKKTSLQQQQQQIDYLEDRNTEMFTNPNMPIIKDAQSMNLQQQQRYILSSKQIDEKKSTVNTDPAVAMARKETTTTTTQNLISKSRTKIVREPAPKPLPTAVSPSTRDAAVAMTRKQTTTTPTQKLISKSRTKIVREPAPKPLATAVSPAARDAPLIRLSSKKLIRRTQLPSTRPARSSARTETAITSSNVRSKYKLDRRSKAPMVKLKRNTFVRRYALRRSNSESKIILRSTKRRSLAVIKRPQMININGVLYKSTRNKLQRKEEVKTQPNKNQSSSSKNTITTSNIKLIKSATNNTTQMRNKALQGGRLLSVSGTKFVLDKSGFKLTRLPSENQVGAQNRGATIPTRQRQRIDIGGLTYIASAKQNVLVRTQTHLALAHLNWAKNRSLQVLTRRFVKTNIPCRIFQRIGKCMAHERGRCNKVHDKQQVAICPRFLRSECHNSACLLSHNVSLAKMPVCKFYLQGVCVRTDCPYLHKKLSHNTDICTDFLRGYCKLAAECNKRHEFVCSEYERNGKCDTPNCTYCKNRKRKQQQQQQQQKLHNQQTTPEQSNCTSETKVKENTNVKEDIQEQEEKSATLRYFIDKQPGCGPSNTITTPATNVVHVNESGELQQQQEQKAQGDAAQPKTKDGEESSDTDDDDDDGDDNEPPRKRSRPKVGVLPAFIPLS